MTTYTAMSGTWNNPTRMNTADLSYADNPLAGFGTAKLTITNYGFDASIPAGSTVTALAVTFKMYCTTGLSQTAITAAGPILTTGQKFQGIAGSATTYTVNLSTDYRGSALAWTRADLLDAVFTFTIDTVAGSGADTVFVDYVTITASYISPGGGTASITSSLTMIVPNQPPARLPEYTVELRATGLPLHHEVIAIVDEFESLTYTRRFNAPGDFALTFHREHPDCAALIGRRNVFRVMRNGVEDFAGLAMKRNGALNGEGPGTWHWTMSGPDMTALVRQRIVAVSSGDSDIQSAVAPGTAISHYFTANYITPAIGGTTRGSVTSGITNLSDVRMGFVTGGGNVVTVVGTNQNLMDFVSEIAQAGGIGYRTRLDLTGGQTVLDCYVGVDRSYPGQGGVLMSFSAENVIGCEYEDDGMSVWSNVYVGGSGVGAARTIQQVTDTGVSDRWGRQEAFVDGSIALTSTAALTSIGKSFINYRSESQRISVTLGDAGMLGYRSLWDVGDTVTVLIPDLSIGVDLPIQEVAVTVTPGNQPTMTIAFGLPVMALPRVLDGFRRTLFSATQSLS